MAPKSWVEGTVSQSLVERDKLQRYMESRDDLTIYLALAALTAGAFISALIAKLTTETTLGFEVLFWVTLGLTVVFVGLMIVMWRRSGTHRTALDVNSLTLNYDFNEDVVDLREPEIEIGHGGVQFEVATWDDTEDGETNA